MRDPSSYIEIGQEFYTHPFVSPADNRTYEDQRDEYLPAARILAEAAFYLQYINDWKLKNPGNEPDESVADNATSYAEDVINKYDSSYSRWEFGRHGQNRRPSQRAILSSKAILDHGNELRFYHVLSHPLVQMLSKKAGEILLQLHEAMKTKGKKEFDEETFKQTLSLLEKSPQIANEVRNKLRHDTVQNPGTGWQTEATATVKEKYNLGQLIDGTDFPNALAYAGFGKPEMKPFIELAARQFFPDGKGGYDKTRSFEGFKKGALEFISTVYCYYTESNYRKEHNGSEITIAEQIEQNIFLLGTIPFEKQDVFNEMMTSQLSALNTAEKAALEATFTKEFIAECDTYKVQPSDRVEYFLATKISAACRGANLDVINFGHKDPAMSYNGDNSFHSETAKKFTHFIKMAPEDRAKLALKMIDDHRPPVPAMPIAKTAALSGSVAGKVPSSDVATAFTKAIDGGFVHKNAKPADGTEGTIYHHFDCKKWPHLNVLSRQKVAELHDTYARNSEIVTRMHQADLVHATFQFLNPDKNGMAPDFAKIDNNTLKSLSQQAEIIFSDKTSTAQKEAATKQFNKIPTRKINDKETSRTAGMLWLDKEKPGMELNGTSASRATGRSQSISKL